MGDVSSLFVGWCQSELLRLMLLSACLCVALWLCIISTLIQRRPDPDPNVIRGLTYSLLTPWGHGAFSQHLLIGWWAGAHAPVDCSGPCPPKPPSLKESLLPAAHKPLFVSPLNPASDKSPQRACQPPCSVQRWRPRPVPQREGLGGEGGKNEQQHHACVYSCHELNINGQTACVNIRLLFKEVNLCEDMFYCWSSRRTRGRVRLEKTRIQGKLFNSTLTQPLIDGASQFVHKNAISFG